MTDAERGRPAGDDAPSAPREPTKVHGDTLEELIPRGRAPEDAARAAEGGADENGSDEPRGHS